MSKKVAQPQQHNKPPKHKHHFGPWRVLATGILAKYCKCGAMQTEKQ